MKAKRIITCIISFILFTVCIPFTATAKVIEPEVVKTEKWTTSYYIDDDIDTLYPYIQCEADIYNDGTIKLYMWNTHEWDGFATVSHTATIIQTEPITQNSMVYCFHNGVPYTDDGGRTCFPCIGNYATTDYSKYKDIDISYYSDKYSCIERSFWGTAYKYLNYYRSNSSYSSVSSCSIPYRRYNGALPEMSFLTARNYYPHLTFNPKEDPTGTYNFRLFGHDITITPELLSGNIVATPSDDGYKTITYNNGSSASKIKTDTDVSDIQEYIDKLEAENALLRQENTELKNKINLLATGTYGDVNGDTVVDVQDAQIILAYYTERDVAKKSVPDLVTFGLKFGKE